MMSCESVFKLDATLEKLSSIAVAIQFWNHPDVQDKVQHYCDGVGISGSAKFVLGSVKNWLKVVNYVTNRVNHPKFPEKLLREVRCYIPVIGEKIYNWIQYVTEERNLNVQYARKIYWTPYGLIDKLKIVEEYWLKESQLLTLRDNDYLNEPSITIAVLYARVNFISENREKMKDELNRLLPEDKRQEHWTVYGLLAAWVIFYTNENSYNALNFLEDYKKPNNLPAKPVFDECVEHNYKFAVEYFWNKLTFNEKETCVAEAAQSCLYSWCESTNCAGYLQENEIELLVFLLNQMSTDRLREFVSKNFLSLMQCFLSTWPYQEFCVNLLNETWEHNPKDIKKLLKLTMKYISCTKTRIQLKNKNMYRLVFEKLLKKTSKEIKEKYFVNKSKLAFYNLYRSFDVFSLSLILNDSDLKEHRIKLISNFENILKDLVVSGNLYDLNRLMDNALSEEEKIIFKRKSDCLGSFVTAGKFKFADDHIKWLYDSESERSAAKERIDALKICLHFVNKYKFDLADEFLNWMFDAEEKKRSVKNSLNKSDEFLRSEIYKIWCSKSPSYSTAHIEAKCSEMLKWFLESDEAISEFKKTKLTNEFFIVKYWKNLYYVHSFCDVDEFLKFCSWTPEEIKNYKENIKNNADYWIDTFGRDDFQMVDALLDWVFEDSQAKKQIISNYMSSPRGILLCVGVFKNYALSKDRVKMFFNSDWVEPLVDMNVSEMEMKMNLDSFEDLVMTDGLKSCILKLLARKKEEGFIRSGDLPENIWDAKDSDESSDDEYGDMFSNYDPSSYSEEEDD